MSDSDANGVPSEPSGPGGPGGPPSASAPYYPAQYTPPAPPEPASGSDPPRRADAPKRRGPGVFLAGIIGGLLGAALVGAAVYLYPPAGTASTTPTTPGTSTPAPTTSPAGSKQDSDDLLVEAVAAKVNPSVVNVSISQSGVDPFTGVSGTRVVGNGSGVIIRSDGYILTNDHVVEAGDSLSIRLGTQDVPAKVVGTDPSTDLAVIKVNKTGLIAAEMGSSSALKVGETVVAIGSPFGLDKTVTSGIVSALHRSNLANSLGGGASLTQYTNLIQTDASINPGNSGGALCDLAGRVVGINTLIQSTSGASAGIGFAIPIDFAKGVADQLIATGKAMHPFLGVSMATADAAVLAQLGLPGDTTGAFIQSVVAGSPAATAGIKANDILVSLGGDPITSVEEAFAAIRSRKVGETVDVIVLRGTQRLTMKVTLGSDATK